MNFLEYLDRAGQRRLELAKIQPHRPRETKIFVAVLFFSGYYTIVWGLLRYAIPAANAALVRDALLVLGPVIGAIGQSIFRSDTRDEQQATNTGEAFRASRAQAEATIAATETTPIDRARS